MYNVRQLVILIASLFIALGIGVAVGLSANSDNLLVQQQRKTIDRLEQDFLSLKADNRRNQLELKDMAKRQKAEIAAFDEILGKFTDDSLKAKRIEVISPDKKYSQLIEQHLYKTGATVYTHSVGEVASVTKGTDALHNGGDSTWTEPWDPPGNAWEGNGDRISSLDSHAHLCIYILDPLGMNLDFPSGMSQGIIPTIVVAIQSGDSVLSDTKEGVLYLNDVPSPIERFRLLSQIFDHLETDLIKR